MADATGSESISPTAHYTGYVWARNGLSHPALASFEGRVLYESLRPLMGVASRLVGVSLEPYLLARHRAIDAVLTGEIEAGRVGSVIEVASGLSPRGWRFSNRYGSRITYVETDLPGMTERKRAALERIGSLDQHHRVQELDALAPDGPNSLDAVAASLDPEQGLAIITEGLLSYLDGDAVTAIWTRLATALHRFPSGTYVSDLHLGELQTAYVRAFRAALSGFVRGRVAVHFHSAADAVARLRACGFDEASVLPAAELVPDAERGGRFVHIIEASTVSSQ